MLNQPPSAPQRAPQPAAQQGDEIAVRVCRSVAELPDRDSPKGWPEAMLVTHEELHAIVLGALNDDQPAPQPAAQQGEVALPEYLVLAVEDAIAAARDALEKAKCAAVAVVDLERAIAEIEAVRSACLRVAAS